MQRNRNSLKKTETEEKGAAKTTYGNQERMQKFCRKVRKLWEYLVTKIRLLWKQKKFRSGQVTLKYMLERGVGEELIIVFSSCTRKGIRARYNYVRTLKNVSCNKLFLLDDFATDHRGAFYLGSNMQFEEADAVKALIDRVREKTGAKRLIFCGSSKGGYTALNFGLEYPESYMVVGGPQYFLGQSLLDTENYDALKHIVGQVCREKIEYLNQYLPKKVLQNPYTDSQRIYLHYSDSEHTYEEHIRYLRSDLAGKGYHYSEDVAHYKEHGEISLYFPEFLLHSVEEILCRPSA